MNKEVTPNLDAEMDDSANVELDDLLRDGTHQLTEDEIKERIARLDRGHCPIDDVLMIPFTEHVGDGGFGVECPNCLVAANAEGPNGPYELLPLYQPLVGPELPPS